MRYSHSKLDVARKCMRLFKFQYIDKIKVDSDTIATDFGGLMHDIAEHYTGGGKSELLALYHKLCPSQYPKIEDEGYRKRIPVALKNIHLFWEENLKGVPIDDIKAEDDIPIKLNDEIDLTGKVDLTILDEKTGRVRIIDYKTSKSKKYADHENQLAMYMLLLNRKYDIPYDVMDCEIIYLSMADKEKDGTPVENIGYENMSKPYRELCEADVELLLEEIENIHHRIKRSIKTGKWTASPGWFNCTYCPYADMCEDNYNKTKE